MVETLQTAMARETLDAPEVVARMLRDAAPAIADVGKLFRLRKPSHIITSARGSSDHAAHYMKVLCEILLGLPCASVGASVVSIYQRPLALHDCIVVAISQSGASPDSLAFAAESKRAGVPLVSITNVPGSALAGLADVAIELGAGPEQSVAATKTFIASVAMAARIVAAWAEDMAFSAAFDTLPVALAKANQMRWPTMEAVAARARSAFVLGRGPSLAMAGEAALKLKETAGVHAEAYSSAEVIHGPMALIEPGFPVMMFAPDDAAYATNLATAERLRAAGADVHMVSRTGGLDYAATGHALLDPISIIQSFYGSAERIARARGKDPDRPKLLSKVTKTL